MNALKPNPPFQILIMSEESRLGRESIETDYALKQLVTAGVRVFFYLEDRERTLDSPTDKIMLSLTAFADELEREKARQRTYDAMRGKARAGQVTGGGGGLRLSQPGGRWRERPTVTCRATNRRHARRSGAPDLRTVRQGVRESRHRKAAQRGGRACATSAAGTAECLGTVVGAGRALPRVVSGRGRLEPHKEA